MDLEALVALDPQLYVDMALYGDQLWYLGESEARVAEIVPTLGISMQQVPIIDSIRRFEELSGMLGADLQSPEVTRAKADFADAEAELQSAIAARPGLRVLVCSPGPDQIYIASSNWMTDLMYFKQLGLDVIAHPGTDAFEALSWERAHTYPADLVLVDKRVSPADMERINEIPTWSRLPAVAAGQVGPWYAGSPYSHRRFAPIMRELADIIRNCRTDVA
jgi:iron complex transport system substrate-binding protein